MTAMINHTPRWSHARGNTVVPSRWQATRVTQYDQHSVRCGCGRVSTAARPEGARSGPVGYGPTLQAFVVSLMVVHFIGPPVVFMGDFARAAVGKVHRG